MTTVAKFTITLKEAELNAQYKALCAFLKPYITEFDTVLEPTLQEGMKKAGFSIHVGDPAPSARAPGAPVASVAPAASTAKAGPKSVWLYFMKEQMALYTGSPNLRLRLIGALYQEMLKTGHEAEWEALVTRAVAAGAPKPKSKPKPKPEEVTLDDLRETLAGQSVHLKTDEPQ